MSQTIPAAYAENTGYPQSIPELYYRVKLYTLSFPANVHNSITSLPLKNYLRLLTIVCAYILIRPYIEKGFQKWMQPDRERLREKAKEAKKRDGLLEDDDAETEEEEIGVGAGDIRSGNVSSSKPKKTTSAQQQQQTQQKEKSSNSSKAAKTTSAESSSANVQEWGEGARKRQAAFFEELEKQGTVGGEQDEGMDPALLKGWDY